MFESCRAHDSIRSGSHDSAFDIPTSDPGFDGTSFVIRTGPDAPDLTIGDDATTLDATTLPGGFSITIEGPGSTSSAAASSSRRRATPSEGSTSVATRTGSKFAAVPTTSWSASR